MERPSFIPAVAQPDQEIPHILYSSKSVYRVHRAHHCAHYIEPDKPGLHPHTYPISSLHTLLLFCIQYCLSHSCY